MTVAEFPELTSIAAVEAGHVISVTGQDYLQLEAKCKKYSEQIEDLTSRVNEISTSILSKDTELSNYRDIINQREDEIKKISAEYLSAVKDIAQKLDFQIARNDAIQKENDQLKASNAEFKASNEELRASLDKANRIKNILTGVSVFTLVGCVGIGAYQIQVISAGAVVAATQLKNVVNHVRNLEFIGR